MVVPLLKGCPTANDYVVAMQQSSTFRRPELARATFDRHPVLGIPWPLTGSSAVVFKAEVDGTPHALRFFTRDDVSTRDRYTDLNAYLLAHGLAGSAATCQWLDDAIALHGRTWPVVQMQWVDGPTLDAHVGKLIERGDTSALSTLARDWRALLQSLQVAQFAHGDLQHGNVLIDPSGRLRLVDFDCVWIPAFTGKSEPAEVGHRNYQRQDRSWGPLMDTFPSLVIYATLLILARDRECWDLYDGDNLIFREHDLWAPGNTPVWHRAARLKDPQVKQVLSQLKQCCARDWRPTGGLESLLSR